MEFLRDHIWWILFGANYLIAFATAGFEVMQNREPVKSISLIFALIVLPFIGIIIYYLFAQDYRKDKIFNRKRVYDHRMIKEWEDKLLLGEEELERMTYGPIKKKIKLVRLLQNNQAKPLTLRNSVKILINGEKKFKLLFEDIEKAEKHIHVEYYTFNSDQIGKRLILHLCKKSEQGVSVKVSYDYVGSSISNNVLKRMKASGIEVYPFMPVWFSAFTPKLNYRNHRKICVIDGCIGYVGGVNVTDDSINYEEDPKNKFYWRDTHLRIRGHAVKSLQAQFLLNFNFVSGREVELKDEYFPEVNLNETTAVQIASSGPDTDWRNIMEAIFTAINTAEKYIYITTPYFIPNNQILTALCTASRQGVDVRIIIPQKGDSVIAKYATNSFIQMLLESGIKVYHYCKGMVHAKTLIVDDVLSSVGTCNLDNRSFEINFEINAFVFDENVATELCENYKADIEESEELLLEEWVKRSMSEKVKESLCRLLGPLL
ncbi:cardiolipin synthase [Salegentibacter chungangensis]|uniref:Cardiolipin synthase n=1 Tax=Salegentibacter chungangensis TaxID=1335724 RepID=A0ABW3NSC3_9FLAO